MADERSGAITNVATPRPSWLDDFLRTREGPTITTAVRLEPFVGWLGSADPLDVSRATLLDVMRLWVDSLGIAKTRATVEVMRDLYSWMRESGAPAAGTLWAATDDFLEARLPVIESRHRPRPWGP